MPPAMAGRTPTPSPRAPRSSAPDRIATVADVPVIATPTPMMAARGGQTPGPTARPSPPSAPAPLLPPPAELSVAPSFEASGIPAPAPTEPTVPVPAGLADELAIQPADSGSEVPSVKRDSWALLKDGQGRPSTARVIIAVGAVVSAALLIYYLWTL
jgi:hypothetical protein